MEKKCGVEVAMLIVPNRSDDSFSSRFVGTSGGESFFSASPEMYPLLDKFEIYTKNRYLGKIFILLFLEQRKIFVKIICLL